MFIWRINISFMCSLSKMAPETYGGTPACALFLIMLFSPLPVYKKYRLQTNKLSGKQLWSAICFKIMTPYTCGFFPRILAIIPATQYTCVLFPSIWPFSYKCAYICAQKIPYICVTNKHVVYGVTESRRIRGTELYCQQKTPSCTMELKSNVSLNQAWPLWPR